MVQKESLIHFFLLIAAYCIDCMTLSFFHMPYTAYSTAAFCLFLFRKNSTFWAIFSAFLMFTYSLLTAYNRTLLFLLITIAFAISSLIKSIIQLTPDLLSLFWALFFPFFLIAVEPSLITSPSAITFLCYRLFITCLGGALVISIKRPILKSILR